MAVCETCGVTFDPAAMPKEMNTARVLCRTCYDKRQAEKAAKLSGKPTAVPVVSAAPTPSVAPSAVASSASRRSASKPAPVDAKAEKRRALNVDDQPVLDRTTKIGLIVTLVIAAGGGGAFLLNRSVRTKEADALAAVKKSQGDFMTRLHSLNLDDYDDAMKAVTMISENVKTWTGTELANEVQTARSHADGFINGKQEERAFLERLAKLEGELADSKSKAASAVSDLRRRAEVLKKDAGAFGKDVETRCDSALSMLRGLYVTKTVEEAKAFADANAADLRSALNKLAGAEDEIRTQIDKAMHDKDATAQTTYTAYYQELITKADALATTFFTESEIPKLAPWTDLLVGDSASSWKAPTNIPGFSFTVANGVLQVKGPSEQAKVKGIVTVGAKQQWRDFVLDIECVIDTPGTITAAFRLGGTLDKNTDNFDITAEEGTGIEPGKPFSFTYTVIGSHRLLKFENDVMNAVDGDLYWSGNRHGAFGIVVPKGMNFRLSRARIRELR